MLHFCNKTFITLIKISANDKPKIYVIVKHQPSLSRSASSSKYNKVQLLTKINSQKFFCFPQKSKNLNMPIPSLFYCQIVIIEVNQSFVNLN